jgi:hypothetical protein
MVSRAWGSSDMSVRGGGLRTNIAFTRKSLMKTKIAQDCGSKSNVSPHPLDRLTQKIALGNH